MYGDIYCTDLNVEIKFLPRTLWKNPKLEPQNPGSGLIGLREVAYPFDQEKFLKEFSLARTLVHNCPRAVFLCVIFDQCIK